MREEFSRKVRRAIIERAAGCCEACSAKLKPGEGEVDHILPDALGGKPVVANGRLLCRVCHAGKTATDIRRIRKADRQRDRATGAMVRRGPTLKGPGFSKRAKPARVEKMQPPRRSLYQRGVLLAGGSSEGG